uniref:Ovule protein n=1 Tax=Steinernema glaseri TaxID=37863 RepID=A0A1I8A330_9BILA
MKKNESTMAFRRGLYFDKEENDQEDKIKVDGMDEISDTFPSVILEFRSLTRSDNNGVMRETGLLEDLC